MSTTGEVLFFIFGDTMPPPMAANAQSVGFGDWQRGCLLRVVDGARLAVLREAYATSGQVGLLLEVRGDIIIVDRSSFALFANSAA